MSEIRTLLPPNKPPEMRAIEAVMAERTDGLAAPIAALLNPATCPAHLLGWLAWAMSVDTWDSSWSDAVKREVIQASVPVHRIKGTRAAVMTSLKALGFHTDLTEWFQDVPPGPPGTFRLDAYGEDVLAAGFQIDAQLLDTVTRIIADSTRLSAHYSFRVGESFRQTPALKTGLRQQHRHAADLSPAPRPHDTVSSPGLASGIAATRRDRRSLLPQPRPHGVASLMAVRTGLRARLHHIVTLTIPPREGAAYAR